MASAREARRARSAQASPFSARRSSPSRSTRAWFALRASGVKRGTMLRKSVRSNFVFSSIFAGEKALAQRAEGHEADAELLERRQDLLLGLPPEQRIFALKCGDRLHGVRAADGLRARLGKAEVLHLAFADQLLDRARDVLDRHVRIDAVLIEQIDDVGLEPLERSLGDLLDVLRPAVKAPMSPPSGRCRIRTWWRSPPDRGTARAPRPRVPRS